MPDLAPVKLTITQADGSAITVALPAGVTINWTALIQWVVTNLPTIITLVTSLIAVFTTTPTPAPAPVPPVIPVVK